MVLKVFMFIRSEGIATSSVGLYSHLNVWAYLRTSAHNTLKTILVLLTRMLFVLIVLCSCSYGEIATFFFHLECVSACANASVHTCIFLQVLQATVPRNNRSIAKRYSKFNQCFIYVLILIFLSYNFVLITDR